jgi:cellulose synthase/poly-beta-1,6-N-acetylglucosamine synthase-like glycosyltransferase
MHSPNVLAIVFWLCCGLVIFTYLGYPVLILILSRAFGRKPIPAALDERDLPSISLLVVAYNEEVGIEARVLNSLALKYPKGKLQIAFASDGSTDRTNAIISKYIDKGVDFFACESNRGKSTVLNETVPKLNGEIVILSDANSLMAPDSALRIARWFKDSQIGIVCGNLVLIDSNTGRNVDGLYWKYESFLKECESRLGALLGSNGGIYAIRKNLFRPIHPGTFNDDMLIPLEAKRLTGCRIIYDKDSIAHEDTAPSIMAEFRRRTRIGAGGFHSMEFLWPLLSPVHGWVTLTLFGHKILRWVCPFLLIAIVAMNVLLAAFVDAPYVWVLALQAMFYSFAFLGYWVPNKPKFLRLFRLPWMFTTMNIALFLGFFRWLRGGCQKGIWKRTKRAVEVECETSHQPVVGTE